LTLIWLAIDYRVLNEGEGWGMMVIILLIITAVVGLCIDRVLQLAIQNRKWLNLVEVVLLLIALTFFFVKEYQN